MFPSAPTCAASPLWGARRGLRGPDRRPRPTCTQVGPRPSGLGRDGARGAAGGAGKRSSQQPAKFEARLCDPRPGHATAAERRPAAAPFHSLEHRPSEPSPVSAWRKAECRGRGLAQLALRVCSSNQGLADQPAERVGPSCEPIPRLEKTSDCWLPRDPGCTKRRGRPGFSTPVRSRSNPDPSRPRGKLPGRARSPLDCTADRPQGERRSVDQAGSRARAPGTAWQPVRPAAGLLAPRTRTTTAAEALAMRCARGAPAHACACWVIDQPLALPATLTSSAARLVAEARARALRLRRAHDRATGDAPGRGRPPARPGASASAVAKAEQSRCRQVGPPRAPQAPCPPGGPSSSAQLTAPCLPRCTRGLVEPAFRLACARSLRSVRLISLPTDASQSSTRVPNRPPRPYAQACAFLRPSNGTPQLPGAWRHATARICHCDGSAPGAAR